MNHLELIDFWNDAHTKWADGQPLPTELEGWRASYTGKGANAVDDDAMPEPWIGDLLSQPEVVTLGLHPGGADAAFQHPGGAWPKSIADHHDGQYSKWAATGPYSGAKWESANGANVHAARRNRFLSAWTGKELAASEVVDFPIFPWHVADWKGSAFTADKSQIQEFVLEPLAAAGARWAFGFGKDWWDLIEALDLPILDRLGDGGRPYPTQVDHRRWLVAEGPGGLRIAAMRLDSMPVPPTAEETEDLRRVLESGPAGENRQRSLPAALEADVSVRLRELGVSYMNIHRAMQAIDDAGLRIDGWQEDPNGDGIELTDDDEVVVRIGSEWADFTNSSPSGTTEITEIKGVHRLELPSAVVTPSSSSRNKEPKPLGMCTECFNVLNPDGTCPMECNT